MADAAGDGCLGWKADLSKYFDSVPLCHIDGAFDKVEARHGHSALIDVLRKYYHNDLYFDEDNVLQRKFQSLKQGCQLAGRRAALRARRGALPDERLLRPLLGRHALHR